MPWRAKLWAVEATLTTRDGADSDEAWEQEVGEQEGPEVVDGEGGLVAVRR